MNNGLYPGSAKSNHTGLTEGAILSNSNDSMSVVNPTVRGVNSLPPSAQVPFIMPVLEPTFFDTQHATISTISNFGCNIAGANFFVRVFENDTDSRVTYYTSDMKLWRSFSNAYFLNTIDCGFWAKDRFMMLGRGNGVNTYLWHMTVSGNGSFAWNQATVSGSLYQFTAAAAGNNVAVAYSYNNSPGRTLLINLPYASTSSFTLALTGTSWPNHSTISTIKMVPAGDTVLAIINKAYVYKYSASAGWVLVNTVDKVEHMYYSSGDLVELYGRHGAVYVSHDAGYTWSVEKTNMLFESTRDDNTSFTIYKSGNLFVTGHCLLASTDRRTWWYYAPGIYVNSQSFSRIYEYAFKDSMYFLTNPANRIGFKIANSPATKTNLRPGSASRYIRIRT